MRSNPLRGFREAERGGKGEIWGEIVFYGLENHFPSPNCVFMVKFGSGEVRLHRFDEI